MLQNYLKKFSAIFWGENDDKKRATLSFGVEDTFLFSLIANLMPSLVLTSMGDFGIFCQYRISLNNMRIHYYSPMAARTILRCTMGGPYRILFSRTLDPS